MCRMTFQASAWSPEAPAAGIGQRSGCASGRSSRRAGGRPFGAIRGPSLGVAPCVVSAARQTGVSGDYAAIPLVRPQVSAGVGAPPRTKCTLVAKGMTWRIAGGRGRKAWT
jgi:hypothetical protein